MYEQNASGAPPRPAQLRPSITKEELNQLHLRRYGGPIVVVENDDACDQAVRTLRREKVLGFDTETRPSFQKGESYLPSLLQLGGEQAVYLFHLQKISRLKHLFRLLATPRILKAGVATDFDVRQLQQLQPFQPAGFVNLETLTDRLGIRNNGLRSLAGLVLGFRISKSEQRSNWSRDPLSRQQIVYAATDAWISREIYLQLQKAIREQGGDGGRAGGGNGK
jgi:ribonuclease D